MRRAERVFAFVFAFLGVQFAIGQSEARPEDPRISVRAKLSPETLAPGERGRLEVEIDVPDGWHLWSLDPGPGPLPLTIEVRDSVIEPFGPFFGDAPKSVYDRGFERDLLQYGDGTTRIGRHFAVADGSPARKHLVEFDVRGQICTDEQCIGQRERVTAVLTVLPVAVGMTTPESFGLELSVRPNGASPPARIEAPERPPDLPPAGDGLFGFMLIAFLFGLGALATPCVFPAIPLTVSFFSKYSDESLGRGVRLAAVYALTMVGAFTFGGVVVSIIFGVSGIQRFASHPVFNLLLGIVLAFFALNLLGLFELRAPTFLTQTVNRLEGRFGRAATPGEVRGGGGWSDYVVVGVAALTATTVFFTCTVAFVGLVLVEAAQGRWFWPSVGMLAFSSAFALPFFLLALFPQGARWLQGRAGSWLGATRVTLGFLELAAATKFLSNADLVWSWGLLTREVVLVLWVPLFVMCAFYLLGKLRIGHETMASPDGGASVPQVLASTLMFAFSLFLAVGLFNGRPFGSWLDGWLPPVVYPNGTSPSPNRDGAIAAFDWHHALEEGRAKARQDGTLVFVNYTGYSCTNCRYMEGGVFPRPEIAKLLRSMTLVELYTDGGKPEHEAAREDQVERFGTAALPLYSVERADGTVIDTFPSSTNDPEEFRRFLEDAIRRGKVTNPPSGASTDMVAEAASLRLKTTRLSDGAPHPAIETGKWNLVNFWATWCGPCKVELKGFMAAMGRDLEAQGGRFAAVAVEEDGSLSLAQEFMESVGVPKDSALRLPDELDATLVDPRLKFDGSTLPYTILVSPTGEVVWRHQAALTKAQLRAVLVEHLGHAALQ